ncbi:MAG: group III truncated hemoglobin [Sporocytophaga sp.]|nr:group III truncated hemoglobin [Sporocytophaga sp.]
MVTDRLKDIASEEDVILMVNSFYEKVNKDELLSYVFNDFSKVNWEKHLPKMYQFWNYLLLGIPEYKGRPFPVHAQLPIESKHFDTWLRLFKANIDEQFSGPVADMAKVKGEQIALTFQYRMGLLED